MLADLRMFPFDRFWWLLWIGQNIKGVKESRQIFQNLYLVLWLELTFSLLFLIHNHQLLRKQQVQYLSFVGVKDGTFDTFPDAPFTWDQSHEFSTRILPSSSRETMKQSTLKSQLPVPNSRIKIVDSTTSTILLIPTSFYGVTLNMTTTTTNVQRTPRDSSQQLSPARKVSSPLLHHTHATFSGTEGRYKWNEANIDEVSSVF